MACAMVLLLLLEIPYGLQQTRLLLRLVLLLRHPGRIAQFGLDAKYVWALCYVPGAMLGLLALLAIERSAAQPDNPLIVMAHSPLGAAFALCSWLAATLWLRSVLRRALAIYREPTALVPVVVLALICLTHAAAMGSVFARFLIGTGGLATHSSNDAIIAAAFMLALYIPLAALANLALVVAHVAMVRAARTWETYVPPQEDEVP